MPHKTNLGQLNSLEVRLLGKYAVARRSYMKALFYNRGKRVRYVSSWVAMKAYYCSSAYPKP